MKQVEDFCPLDRQDWRNWLKLNHKKRMQYGLFPLIELEPDKKEYLKS